MNKINKTNRIPNEKCAEILLQHYQDTFQLILFNTKIRNRLFIYSLLILALIIFDACSPSSLTNLFNAYIDQNFKNKIDLNFDIIIAAVWFLLLCLMIEYYKRSMHVDRQFRYLGGLEQDLNDLLGDDFITREGKSYESKTGVYQKDEKEPRPFCLRAIGPLYTYIFPVALSGIIIWRTIDSFSLKITALFNASVGLIMIFYSAFYIKWIISGKRKPQTK